MSEPNRRFTFALTAAVAATTVAFGITAATLLGWFAAAPQGDPAVVYVPIAPTAPPDPPAAVSAGPPGERVAMDEPREHEDVEREHEREHDDD